MKILPFVLHNIQPTRPRSVVSQTDLIVVHSEVAMDIAAQICLCYVAHNSVGGLLDI